MTLSKISHPVGSLRGWHFRWSGGLGWCKMRPAFKGKLGGWRPTRSVRSALRAAAGPAAGWRSAVAVTVPVTVRVGGRVAGALPREEAEGERIEGHVGVAGGVAALAHQRDERGRHRPAHLPKGASARRLSTPHCTAHRTAQHTHGPAHHTAPHTARLRTPHGPLARAARPAAVCVMWRRSSGRVDAPRSPRPRRGAAPERASARGGRCSPGWAHGTRRGQP